MSTVIRTIIKNTLSEIKSGISTNGDYLSTDKILLHQVCTSEGSACLGFRHVIFDDVMRYNSLTTSIIWVRYNYHLKVSFEIVTKVGVQWRPVERNRGKAAPHRRALLRSEIKIEKSNLKILQWDSEVLLPRNFFFFLHIRIYLLWSAVSFLKSLLWDPSR